jgi:molybdenum cofactor cytidylyltransferase
MSRRYGSPKQLADVEGRTVLEHVVRAAIAAGLRPTVVVLPAWLMPPGLDVPGVQLVRNPFPERGLSLSLRLGLAAAADASAALILLGDQPGISQVTIAAVIAARDDRPIVAAFADGVPGPPVLIERAHFHLADGLSGDVGLRDLLRGDPGLLTRVPVSAHAADLDSPDDLGRLSGP